MRRWQVGGWTITRVADPGFELLLPQDDETRVAPLFEAPGGGTILRDGDRWRLEPAT